MSHTQTIELKTEGRRCYVLGNTYPIKESLRSAGCHWDAERRAWWIGEAKRGRVEELVERHAPATAPAGYTPPTPEELSNKCCLGRAEYKGRSYYVVGQSKTGKLLLTVLDCSISFWAEGSQCRIVHRYRPLTQGSGRSYQVEAQTVGKIRRFIESKNQQEKADAAQGFYSACGRSGCARRQGQFCVDCHDAE